MKKDTTAHQSLLGKTTPYCSHYDPSLLFPIPRQEKRDELGIQENTLPFYGHDTWTAYEVSWLNKHGKPIVAIAEFNIPATSPNLIESKSFKLYLNSFNQTRFDHQDQVIEHWSKDLSECAASPITIQLYSLDDYTQLHGKLSGKCLDDLDITIDDYQLNPSTLNTENTQVHNEKLYSHLLKSNCLVTGQPDWGSLYIEYSGKRIDEAALLSYIISFREHNEFHEQCVERIYMDIQHYCQPDTLTVYARYLRRGGLDINPYRSSENTTHPMPRLSRQ